MRSADNDHADVVVVGAGVIGLTTAIECARRGHTVRVVAHDIPGITSRSAGASWGPYLVEPWDDVRRWSLRTLDVLQRLADVPGTGVSLTWGLEASRSPMPAPPWAELLPGLTRAEPHELPPGFHEGFRFAIPLIDMPVHLGHLTNQARALGVTFQQQTVAALSELAHRGRVIINCAAIEPRLAAAPVLEHRIGLRPTRDSIRVELDTSGQVPVVHNYGHGGAGVTCSWGCAARAADLAAV